MIHDAHVEVTCDGVGCNESIVVPLHIAYRTMSASSGFYDHSDAAVEKEIIKQGWRVEGSQHLCEGCQV